MERLIVEVNNISCEVIATFHSEKTNKDYIIYTDKTYNNEKRLNLYFGLYSYVKDKIQVKKLEDKIDNKICKEIIEEISNTI